MSLIRIDAPASEPVSLVEAKAACKVEHSVDDTLFAIWIKSAREAAEQETGRAIITQTWELRLDAFPAGEIELAKPPVSAITSVKYTDADTAEQTVAGANYTLASSELLSWVIPITGYSWPSAKVIRNAVRVRFVTGYADAAAVPAGIKQWMLMQIAAANRNREAFVAGFTVAALPNRFVDHLLDGERTYL